jgi:serine O-acetyltransferase
MIADQPTRCAAYSHHRLSGLRSAIAEDIRRYATYSSSYRPRLTLLTGVSIFCKPALLCLCFHRLAHYCYVRRWHVLAHLCSRLNLIVHKAHIPPQSCIGPGCFLGHCPGLTFHGTAGRDLTLLSLAICCPDELDFGSGPDQGPCLGDGVLIGAHAVVIGPVQVGDGAKVAANTWLNFDCAAQTVAYSARVRHSARPL